MSVASPATAIDRLLALARAARGMDGHVQDLPPDARREIYERTVRRSLLSTGSALRRGHGILATVGLVGTVIGIVDAFQHIRVGCSSHDLEHRAVGEERPVGVTEPLSPADAARGPPRRTTKFTRGGGVNTANRS